jgi:hypothetical protein
MRCVHCTTAVEKSNLRHLTSCGGKGVVQWDMQCEFCVRVYGLRKGKRTGRSVVLCDAEVFDVCTAEIICIESVCLLLLSLCSNSWAFTVYVHIPRHIQIKFLCRCSYFVFSDW